MPTPRAGYYTAQGKRVPGVTTILGRFKDSGGLIHWSNQLAYVPYRTLRAMIEKIARQGHLESTDTMECIRLLKPPPDFCDYRTARDTAAGIGTIVHAMIDGYIRKKPVDLVPFIQPDLPDPLEAARPGFEAFLEWARNNNFQLQEGEVQLVSEKWSYGGTPDTVLASGDGEAGTASTVGDWKTGDLYPEQVMPQLAAYRELLLENGHQVGKGAHAISINKKTGGFVHRYFTPAEMALGWKAFILMRELYDLVKELK